MARSLKNKIQNTTTKKVQFIYSPLILPKLFNFSRTRSDIYLSCTVFVQWPGASKPNDTKYNNYESTIYIFISPQSSQIPPKGSTMGINCFCESSSSTEWDCNKSNRQLKRICKQSKKLIRKQRFTYTVSHWTLSVNSIFQGPHFVYRNFYKKKKANL